MFSMNKFGISDAKANALLKRMAELGIREEDFRESFVKGSGPGGQKINKTSSCVKLFHLSTNIDIKCQKDRSLALNRYHARRILCDRIEREIKGEIEEERKKNEKIRRQKRRRSRRTKLKMIEDKKKSSEKKQMRRIKNYEFE